MKNTLRVAMMWLALISFSCLGISVSSACTPPPSEGINLTWPPSARVQVLPDSQVDTFSAVTTAVNNWNTATQLYCYTPTFTFGSGTGQTMTVAYGPIPSPPGSTIVVRGLTQITTSGRISSATTTINSNIPLTFPNVMTEVMAHEVGHTMGLNDCNGCDIYSNVMVTNVAGVPTWTGTQGQPGPTACDLSVMETVATDYLCPPPPPPHPPPCYCDPEAPDPMCCASPIIIDLSGKGFFLTSAKDGVLFNFSGKGAIQVGWTAQGAANAFLCLPDINGRCDDGADLFGNFTPQPKSDHPNGFAVLAVYDDPKNGGNGDGIIDSRDAVFASLRLWIDANHDGISQPGELNTLPSLGVNSISLAYKADQRTDQYGNVFRYRAQVNPGDQTNTGRIAYDVFFVTANPTANVRSCPVPMRTGR